MLSPSGKEEVVVVTRQGRMQDSLSVLIWCLPARSCFINPISLSNRPLARVKALLTSLQEKLEIVKDVFFLLLLREAIRLATDYLQDRIFVCVRLNLSVSVYLGFCIYDV